MIQNRLADATSPYLLEHAEQSVNWQPWDPAALQLARSLDRPVLLSIGYSTCHSCHVMARESFGDPTIAALLNRSFVCIKIDREERPDIDRVYQLALTVLTREGGSWPLTLFLHPQTLVPFFGGTYFPRTASHGLPGLTDILLRVEQVFREQRSEIESQCDKVAEVLGELNAPGAAPAQLDDRTLLTEARAQLAAQYDAAEGGFGSAPKFPMPTSVERLLLGWARSRQSGAADRAGLEMVMQTLTRMARGGIYDHLGGGFFRYAIDRKWTIPHFEKLLSDNGQLLALYADALTVGGDDLFRMAVTGTADWLLRELRHSEGGFRAAVRADSEEEGRYYLWRRDEVRRLLTPQEYLVVETLYGLDKPANCQSRWMPYRRDAWRAVVERLSLDRGAADRLLAEGRAKLLAARDQRPAPAIDGKILAGCNGLAIKGLARAARALDRPDWLAAARAAADFLRQSLWRDGVLHASWIDGAVGHAGFLDDYANLLDGLLELLRTGWREQDARFAVELAEALSAGFEDREHGGLFFSSHADEPLIYRPKPTLDEAQPAGNGVVARVLTQLGHLFGRADFLATAQRTLAWSRSPMEQYPAGHCALLAALEQRLDGPEHIILRGPEGTLTAWHDAAAAGYHPNRPVYTIPYGAYRTLPRHLPKLVSADLQATTCAYWCKGDACDPPISSLAEFRKRLAE